MNIEIEAGHIWLFSILIWVSVWALAGLIGVMIFAAVILFCFSVLVIAGKIINTKESK